MITDIFKKAGSRSAAQSKEGEVTFSCQYTIITDDPTDGPVVVAYQSGFQVGDLYETYPIQSLSISEDDDPQQWTLTITYGTVKKEKEPDPRLQPPVITVSYDNHQVPIDNDITGKPILNTAGDLFSDYMTVDDSRPVLSFKVNLATFPWSLANNYANKVNRDRVFNCRPGTLKFQINSINPVKAKVNNTDIEYYETSYEIAYDPEGWNNKKVLNQGYREKNDDGELVPILIDGKEATTPVLLGADGKRLPDGDPPHYLTFKKHRDISFAAIFGNNTNV